MLEEPSAKHIILAIVPPGDDRTILKEVLSQTNWQVVFSNTFREAQTALRTFSISVVLSDSHLLDGYSWRDVLQELSAASSPIPLIVADLLADEALWAEVLNLGGYDVLAKPFEPRELLQSVSAAERSSEYDMKRAAAIARKPIASWSASPPKRAAVGGG